MAADADGAKIAVKASKEAKRAETALRKRAGTVPDGVRKAVGAERTASV